MTLSVYIGKIQKMFKFIYIFMFFSCLTFAGENEDNIRQQVNDYVLSQIQVNGGDKLDLEVNPIDNRLNLSICKQPLNISVAGKGEIRRNTTVTVICPDENGWRTFVPVKVRIQKPVIVASTPIGKGNRLSTDMLTISYIDDYMLNGDMTTDMNFLIGAKSKRDIQANQPIRQSQICIVCRDDTVEIIAEKNGLQIRTTGRALQDGNLNDQIRVQNIRSKRIISARVSDVGQVKVQM